MNISKTQQAQKYQLVIEYLNENQPFKAEELTSTFEITNTLPYILYKNEYLKRVDNRTFQANENTQKLTVELLKNLVNSYNKERQVIRANKVKPQKQLKISDFLNARLNTESKESKLAKQIFELIKPYL